ncbi:MAG: HAD-IIB family hydrolase [Patescibacteria group bacterium]
MNPSTSAFSHAMIINHAELVVFDLDGTLAPSKSPLERKMAELLGKLLTKKKVAVISGGTYEQMKKQLLAHLPAFGEIDLTKLFLFPTSGTSMYTFEKSVDGPTGQWIESYANRLTAPEKETIMTGLYAALHEAGYTEPTEKHGKVIEDRGTQITFSALGQEAPLELKSAWDPDHSKRKRIVDLLNPRIPGFEARMGGSTSVDITRAGRSKAYGIKEMSRRLKIPIEQMVFVGDELVAGGNDESVKVTGIATIAVKDPADTAKILDLV